MMTTTITGRPTPMTAATETINESQLLAEAVAQEEQNFCGGASTLTKYKGVCEQFIELLQLRDFESVFRDGYKAASIAATIDNNIEYRIKLKKLICLLNSAYNVKTENFVFLDNTSMDVKIWGNILWSFFHLASVLAQYYYAATRDVAAIDYFVTSLYNIDEILPCNKCRAHYLVVKSGPHVLEIIRKLAFGLLVGGTFQFHQLISRNIESHSFGVRRHSIYDLSQYNMLDFAVDWNCWPLVSTPELSYSNEFLSLRPVFHCSNFARLSLVLNTLTPRIPTTTTESDTPSALVAYPNGARANTKLGNSNELVSPEFADYSMLAHFTCVDFGDFIIKCIDGIQQQHQQQQNKEEARYSAMFTREKALAFVLALIRRNLLYETLCAGRPPRSWPTMRQIFASRREFRSMCRNWLDAMRMRDMFGLPTSYNIELDDGTRVSVINHITGDYDDYDNEDTDDRRTATSSNHISFDNSNSYNNNGSSGGGYYSSGYSDGSDGGGGGGGGSSSIYYPKPYSA